MRREMMAWVVAGEGSLHLSSFSSDINLLRTEWNRDWAKTPITSAYKSAITNILAAFGLFCTLHSRNNNFVMGYILICKQSLTHRGI